MKVLGRPKPAKLKSLRIVVGFRFWDVFVVSGPFGGPGGVKIAPGDLFGRVLTNFLRPSTKTKRKTREKNHV